MICNTWKMTKICPLQSPVKHSKYSASKIIAVPNTAYIIWCWHRLSTTPKTENSHSIGGTVSLALTALLQHGSQIKYFLPVEVQSVSHWQRYCSTVLNQIFPSLSRGGTVSLALAALLPQSAQIFPSLSRGGTVSLALAALLPQSAQIFPSHSSGGMVSLALAALLPQSAQIFPSHSNGGTVSLALAALLRHSAQILRLSRMRYTGTVSSSLPPIPRRS